MLAKIEPRRGETGKPDLPDNGGESSACEMANRLALPRIYTVDRKTADPAPINDAFDVLRPRLSAIVLFYRFDKLFRVYPKYST